MHQIVIRLGECVKNEFERIGFALCNSLLPSFPDYTEQTTQFVYEYI